MSKRKMALLATAIRGPGFSDAEIAILNHLAVFHDSPSAIQAAKMIREIVVNPFRLTRYWQQETRECRKCYRGRRLRNGGRVCLACKGTSTLSKWVPKPMPWANPVVLIIARECHDNLNYSDLPILADAMEDAGCDDMDILCHLRYGKDHLPGCWALDTILGQE